jgi:hypothetical protein
MRRTTIFLPEKLHGQLRADALRAKTSLSAFVRAKLQDSAERSRRRKASQDPILKVAGICRGPVLSDGIDGSLYGQ